MVNIDNLQVHFEVEGDDEEVFARLFDRFIQSWSRMEAEVRDRERFEAAERLLGDGMERENY